MVTGILEMVRSQWKYCYDIAHKLEEDGLRIKHHEWLKGQVQIHLAMGTESMEAEYHHLVRVTLKKL